MAVNELPRNPAESIRKMLVERHGSENVDHAALDAAARFCEAPMTPLERAARRLYHLWLSQPDIVAEMARNGPHPDFDSLSADRKRYFVDQVRAVLTAIREPSETARQAGATIICATANDVDEDSGWRDAEFWDEAISTWQAMIDALLAEEG